MTHPDKYRLALQELHTLVSSVCPIHGVSISEEGTPDVSVQPHATPEQRAAATDVLESYVVSESEARSTADIKADLDMVLNSANEDRDALHRLLAHLTTVDPGFARNVLELNIRGDNKKEKI